MIRPGLLAALLLSPCAAAAERGFITCQSANSLVVVDLASGETLATHAIPGAPAGVAVAPDGRVHVTSPESGTLTTLDPSTGETTALTIGGGPLGIAANPVTGALYVADWYDDRISIVEQDRVTGEVAVGHSPSGVAVSPDGATILTADRDSDQISVIDAVSRARVATIPVGIRPFGITIDPEGRFAYSANVGSNDVSVIDIAAREVVATIPTGERPYKVALARERGFVTNSYGDSVTAFDIASRAPIATIAVGEYPEGIETSPDGASVYVANWFSNTLSVIDPDRLEVLREIEVGDGPRAFGDFILE